MDEHKCCNPHRAWLAAADSFWKSLKLFRLSILLRISVCRACTHQAVDNSQPPPAFDAPGSGSFPPPAVSRIPKYFRWLRGRPAQGFPARNFGQHAQREKAEGARPSEKPVLPLTLNLTEAELREVSFAVLCQITDLQDGHEADEPEVIAAIARLDGLLGRFEVLGKGRSS